VTAPPRLEAASVTALALAAALLAGCASDTAAAAPGSPAELFPPTRPMEAQATGATRYQRPAAAQESPVERVFQKTAQQASGMAGSAASRSVYTSTGGGYAGALGSGVVRNSIAELRRWWFAKPARQ
jgi:hypothetical protein